MVPNVLNPKALERQLKILETRIGELQTEIGELEKMRSACHTLLGTTSESSEKTEETDGKSDKRVSAKIQGPDLPPRILDLLRKQEAGMTADEIFDGLREAGVPLRAKRPVALVYETLEKHPELFAQSENGIWVCVPTEASPSSETAH